jgi:DNA replication protein DnaC
VSQDAEEWLRAFYEARVRYNANLDKYPLRGAESPQISKNAPSVVQSIKQMDKMPSDGLKMRFDTQSDQPIRQAADWLRSGQPWLLLMGGVGTGKTVLMQSIGAYLKELYRQQRGNHIYPSAVEYCYSFSVAAGRMSDVPERYAPVLCIDDFGVEPAEINIFGTKRAFMSELLYERYDKRRVTIISTNYPLAEIRAKYGERVYDRLCEIADRIVFDYPSFRVKNFNS